MFRTQIYLTEAEHRALRNLAHRTGRTQSELIREAIDEMLAVQASWNRLLPLRQARGLWRTARTCLRFPICDVNSIAPRDTTT